MEYLGRSWRELQLGKRQGLKLSRGRTSIKVASYQGSSHLSHQEERVLSGALEASKVLLEEQLEIARERSARLHETQRENLLLRTRLGEAHAVS